MNKYLIPCVIGILVVSVYLKIGSSSIYDSENALFTSWKQKYNIVYQNHQENIFRQTIFIQNYKFIESQNLKNHTYKLGINQFAALSIKQFQNLFLNHNFKKYSQSKNPQVNIHSFLPQINVDWQTAGAVTPVVNQGSSSSIAYGILGGLQGLTKTVDGNLQAFAPQTLTNCVKGGIASEYYKFLEVNGIDYKYTPSKCNGAFKIKSVVSIQECNTLINAIQINPITVAVDATNWIFYASGIFNNCGHSLNHLPLLTGITDTYWRIKNSWGATWGQKGYIRLSPGDTCGVCQQAYRPTK